MNIAGGSTEGYFYPSDMQALDVPLYAIRGHLSTLITLGHEALAARAPDVSFMQVFPGAVRTPLFDQTPGVLGVLVRCFVAVAPRWLFVPIEESGERNLFFATSGAYPAREGNGKSGVQVVEGVDIARCVDGNTGSGVYSMDYDGTEAGQKIVDLLKQYREEGMVQRVWEHAQEVFGRITSLD